jgi:NAD(P)-dependent dehydrogenase (short-subunit alcohol dehydrogenase family)
VAPLIAQGTLRDDALSGRVAVVTGSGGGIGFEAARSLLWLGARVAIAEIDASAGRDAEERLRAESSPQRVLFVPTDVADEASVGAMAAAVETQLGPVGIVINNAGYFPVGTLVADTPIGVWDRSYAVNLRGTVLTTRAFLPGMTARGHGVIAFVSSTGGALMAAYETLKAAQVSLGATLDQELEGTGVVAFTIGPGLVPTATAIAAIETLAPKLGLSVPQFYASVPRAALLSVEAAGAGFAAAVARAEHYAGQEISSMQALVDAGIEIPTEGSLPPGVELPPTEEAASPAAQPAGSPHADTPADLATLAQLVRTTLAEQSAGWRRRSFFERQWVLRDFKQRTGMPVERTLDLLTTLGEQLTRGDVASARAAVPALEKLARYYGHLAELARGYVKDSRQRDEQVGLVVGWQQDVEALLAGLVTGL